LVTLCPQQNPLQNDRKQVANARIWLLAHLSRIIA
jgi:hypothetical protein